MIKKILLTINLLFFLLGRIPLAYADSSYIEFAQLQAAKIAAMTAPYQVEVDQITKKVKEQQQSIKVKNISQAITSSQPLLINRTTAQQSSESIYIFVSFSMPETSLKQWLEQAHHKGANVVIRGLINNSFKDTISVITRLVSGSDGGLLLDPTLFQKFNIQQVPAVVIAQDDTCFTQQSCIPRFDVIYGDVTLEYALQQLQDKRGKSDA